MTVLIENNMKVYLVQHGEAHSKDVIAERPLTDKGHEDIAKISNFLAQANIKIGLVIHSGKKRAEQTAEYFIKYQISNSSKVADLRTQEHINPNDPPDFMIKEIKLYTEDTLIVGHLPFLSKLVSQLLTTKDSCLVNFLPGSIVCLEKSDDGSWNINWMLRPELLGPL